MNGTRTLATAGRVLRQLSHDHRSIALMLVAPSLLVGLFAWLFSEQDGVFDIYGPPILALFPFIIMFLITSRRRCSETKRWCSRIARLSAPRRASR